MKDLLFFAALLAPLAGAVCVWGISLYGRAIPGNGWRNARDGMIWGSEGLALLGTAGLALRGTSTLALPGVCGMGLYFTADALRCALALQSALLWLIVSLYARGYLAHTGHKMRYYWFWLVAESAALGACLAGDLFTALIFLTVLVLTAGVLGAHSETEAAQHAAARWLTYGVAGASAALGGAALMLHLTGGLRYELLGAAGAQSAGPGLTAALLLLTAGLAALCALAPLHGWLPDLAAEAPAPVAILLGAAISRAAMPALLAVMAGIAGAGRAGLWAFFICGAAGMLWGALRALREANLRRVLGELSVSAGGAAAAAAAAGMLAGAPGTGRAAALAALGAGLYLAALGLCAADFETCLHTQELGALTGCGRGRDGHAAVFGLGALGLAGVPLTAGFALQLLVWRCFAAGGGTPALLVLPALFWLWSALQLANAVRLWLVLFVRRNADPAMREKQDAPRTPLPAAGAAALILAAVLVPLGGAAFWALLILK